jgi:uncharacterized membrane protein
MKFHLKTMLATVVLFIACSLVPFFTFSLFKNSFQLEPLNFWRFTPSIPIKEIPMNWIIATIVANVIIAFFAVVAYRIFQKAIQGSWFQEGGYLWNVCCNIRSCCSLVVFLHAF